MGWGWLIVTVALHASSGSPPDSKKLVDPVATAKAENDRGRTLYEAGDYKTAEGHFRTAWEHQRANDKYAWNLTVTLDLLGRELDALEMYELYVAQWPDGVRRKDAERGRRKFVNKYKRRYGRIQLESTPPMLVTIASGAGWSLERRTTVRRWLPPGEYVARFHNGHEVGFSVVAGRQRSRHVELQTRGWLEVSANVEGAEVLLPGEETCPAPCRKALAFGSLVITVRAPGHEDWTHRAIVTVGKTTQVVAKMVAKTVIQRPVEPTPPKPIIIIPVEPTTKWQPIVGWTAIGLGLAAGAGGLAAHLVAIDEALGVNDAGGATDADIERIEGFLPIYAALYAVGGALVITGAIILATDDDEPEQAGEGALWVAPTPLGVKFGGRF